MASHPDGDEDKGDDFSATFDQIFVRGGSLRGQADHDTDGVRIPASQTQRAPRSPAPALASSSSSSHRTSFSASLPRSRSERPRRFSDSSTFFAHQHHTSRAMGAVSSKRKASSPTEKPSKLAQNSFQSLRLPIIYTDDIWSTASQPEIPAIETSNSSSDSDDDGLTYSRPNLPRSILLRMRSSPMRTGQSNPSTPTATVPGRKLSALLVSAATCSPLATTSEQTQFRYLPLCPEPTITVRSRTDKAVALTVLPSYRRKFDGAQEMQPTVSLKWPPTELPVELFDLITAFLSRDDVKSMRLVNHEFEQKVSCSLFRTSVVPFNTELYDMIDEDKKIGGRMSQLLSPNKGKAKATAISGGPTLSDADARSLQWLNAKEDKDGKVYKGHGLRVFQGFGPHIRRFGMSFDVSEEQLIKPLIKKQLDHVVAYHGSYNWPSQYYTRFANLAGLENTADETSRMRAAFSNLEVVQELALSIDSGLGWLSGPDKSIRARIFERPSPVFGTAYDVPDHQLQAAIQFWKALKDSQLAFDPQTTMCEVTMGSITLKKPPNTIPGLSSTLFADTSLWPLMYKESVAAAAQLFQLPTSTVLYTTDRQPDFTDFTKRGLALCPNDLRKEQKEWLLETQWAQQAFLESYMLAVIDNPLNFTKVKVLNIAKLSSRFLMALSRVYFWDALPCLEQVTLQVSPDWRSVDKDDTGTVNIDRQNPSDAVNAFFKDILSERVAPRKSIKKLTIGWVGGGEHAEGTHARNAHVLPAPISQLEHCTANRTDACLVFPYVEHLTLSNCWITPPMLEGLVKGHANMALKKLTLESVSLTAHPKFPFNGGQGAVAIVPPVPNNQPVLNQPVLTHAQGWNIPNQQLNQQGHPQIWQIPPMNAPNANPNNAQFHPFMAINVPPINNQPAVNVAAQLLPDNTPWMLSHREGSWPHFLDLISPGPTLRDYLEAPQPWEEQPAPRPHTNLQTLELRSVGYILLPRLHLFDQSTLPHDPISRVQRSKWLYMRWYGLKNVMLDTQDRFLGEIVTSMVEREVEALRFGWGVTVGWTDQVREQEATYDGCPPGGTGRATGVIEKGMGLVGQRMGDGEV